MEYYWTYHWVSSAGARRLRIGWGSTGVLLGFIWIGTIMHGKGVIYSILLNASMSWGFHAHVSVFIRTCRVPGSGLVFRRGRVSLNEIDHAVT
jgi:hypothetical protein